MNAWTRALGRATLAAPSASVVLQFAILAAVSILAGARLELGAGYPVKALAGFAFIGAIVIVQARRRLAAAVFGAANQITLGRAALTALLIGLFGEPAAPVLAWTALAVAIAVSILDGVDGTVARRRGEESEFGARFDMEIDALLILVLAVLALQFGKAGTWVLAAGLLRYAFVAAGVVVPWLAAPLPPRRRRQVVCVVQIVSLIVCLAPVIPTPWSAIAAALGIGALTWSFAVDVLWLGHNRRRSTQ